MSRYDNSDNFTYSRGLSCGGVELGCYRNTTVENAIRRARRLSKHPKTRKNKTSFHDLTMSGEVGDNHHIIVTFNNGRQTQKIITGDTHESD